MVDLLSNNEELIFRSFHDSFEEKSHKMEVGIYNSLVTIPKDFLAPKKYYLHFQATIHDVRMLKPTNLIFPIEVQNTSVINRAYIGDPIRGLISPLINWKTTRIG